MSRRQTSLLAWNCPHNLGPHRRRPNRQESGRLRQNRRGRNEDNPNVSSVLDTYIASFRHVELGNKKLGLAVTSKRRGPEPDFESAHAGHARLSCGY